MDPVDRPPASGGGGRARAVRRRRDRHGHGLRGPLVPQTVTVGGRELRVPAARTRGERFDDLVLDAVEQLEERWALELSGVEFAVEDVPPAPASADGGPGAGVDEAGVGDIVGDETAGGTVPLARLIPAASPAGPPAKDAQPARVIVYRRPLEARAADRADLADLVREVVVEQLARLLGREPDEIDPPRD